MNRLPVSIAQPRCAPVKITKGRVTGWFMRCETCEPVVMVKEKNRASAQAAALLHMRKAHQWMPNAIRNL